MGLSKDSVRLCQHVVLGAAFGKGLCVCVCAH